MSTYTDVHVECDICEFCTQQKDPNKLPEGWIGFEATTCCKAKHMCDKCIGKVMDAGPYRVGTVPAEDGEYAGNETPKGSWQPVNTGDRETVLGSDGKRHAVVEPIDAAFNKQYPLHPHAGLWTLGGRQMDLMNRKELLRAFCYIRGLLIDTGASLGDAES